MPGRITADLDYVTPEEALQIVLDTHGLVAENRGQTLIVWTVGENKDTTKTTYTYRLWYADSKEIVATLTPVLGDGKITCNQSANAVIISGTPGEVMQAREVLRHLDVPEKQVKVEAQVLAVNRAYAKELGLIGISNHSQEVRSIMMPRNQERKRRMSDISKYPKDMPHFLMVNLLPDILMHYFSSQT